MMRVGDYIAQRLKAMGSGPVFLLSGGGMMHLMDAIGRAELDYICCHHEQACAMAAEGFARQSGQLGVCYATTGPGATNLVTGVAGAWLDSAPVLFLTGQSKRSQTIHLAETKGLRQFGTFEVDIVPVVQSITKFAHFLDDPLDVRRVLEKAIHCATTGRPGPVLIDVPLDVQGALIDEEKLEGYEAAPSALPTGPAEVDLADVRERLQAAERPVLLVGHGVRVAGGIAALRAAAERHGIPVILTQLAKDALPYDHALFVGHCGPKGDRAGNFALQAADLIIAVGSSLHSQTVGYEADLFAPAAIKIQVDIDPAVLHRGDIAVDRRIQSDVADFLAALARMDPVAPHSEWQTRCAGWKERLAVRAEPHDTTTAEINFYEFAEALSDALAGNETIVTDAGSAFYVMGQAFRSKAGQRYIVSGGLGAMGYALPASIGAAAADTEHTVICVTGDGSLMTNVHELQTLAHAGLTVKVFVIDNDGYASIRNTQKGFFKGRFIGASRDSGVSTPDLSSLATAFSLPFERIDDRTTIAERIRQILASPGPALVGVTAQPGQVIIPTVVSHQTPEGGLRSNPLHVMYPPLPDTVLAKEWDDLTKADAG